MANEELKQRIKDKTAHIKSDLQYQLDKIEWKDKLNKARAFFKKVGKEGYERYKKLPQKARRVFLSVAILASVTGGIKVAQDLSQKIDNFKLKREIKTRKADIREKLETEWMISDKTNFENLYQEALPLIQLSMFPTECLILNPYSDNLKKVSNTIGLGSFYYPKSGNPVDTHWETFSKHIKRCGSFSISAEQALGLCDGWFRHMDGGAMYNQLFKLLKGTTLNAHEFAAIATVMYNSQTAGKDLCAFVKEHHNDPMKCAQKIISYSAGEKFGGIPKRHIHEAYLYLGYDNYMQKMYDFFVKTGVNSKGHFYAKTSVTQLSDDDVAAAKAAINSGKKSLILQEQEKITRYICKGGQTVREIILENVHDNDCKNALLSFGVFNQEGVPLQDILDAKTGSAAEVLYAQSLEIYNKGRDLKEQNKKHKAQRCFKQALSGFQKIIEGGHDGPDLHNDMAITYYHLGQYKKCIEESRKVLAWGDSEQYSAANFNAALAYEKLGNYDKALNNYQAGIKNGGNEKDFKSKIDSLQMKQAQLVIKVVRQ